MTGRVGRTGCRGALTQRPGSGCIDCAGNGGEVRPASLFVWVPALVVHKILMDRGLDRLSLIDRRTYRVGGTYEDPSQAIWPGWTL